MIVIISIFVDEETASDMSSDLPIGSQLVNAEQREKLRTSEY